MSEVEEFELEQAELVAKFPHFFAERLGTLLFARHSRYRYTPGQGWALHPGPIHILIKDEPDLNYHVPIWARYHTSLCGVGVGGYNFTSQKEMFEDGEICKKCAAKMRVYERKHKTR